MYIKQISFLNNSGSAFTKRETGVPGLPHQFKIIGQVLPVVQKYHFRTGHHDFFGYPVFKAENILQQFLLTLVYTSASVAFRNYHPQFFLAVNQLALTGGLKAQQLYYTVGGAI